jgi:hypothetical protein
MFERLDATRSLTANQRRIVVAAILGDMLEFFDYFLIGFVLAFIVGPWQLSFGHILALTPDHGWIFLTVLRFLVGFGVGGLYCVDLPLVQEFVPASRRGFNWRTCHRLHTHRCTDRTGPITTRPSSPLETPMSRMITPFINQEFL